MTYIPTKEELSKLGFERFIANWRKDDIAYFPGVWKYSLGWQYYESSQDGEEEWREIYPQSLDQVKTLIDLFSKPE